MRSVRKIKHSNEIASYRGKSLGWVNREGSTEEEEFKLKSHTEKELPLREQGKCAPRREFQIQKD